MSDEDFSDWQKKLFVVAIISILGGNAGSIINYTSPSVRYEAWTSSMDADRMEHERQVFNERFHRLEKVLDDVALDSRLALKNDAVCQNSMDRCQTNMQQLKEQLDYHIRHDHGNK